MDSDFDSSPTRFLAGVNFTPSDITRRRAETWSGLTAEAVETTRMTPFAYGIKGPFHLLSACERAARDDGESRIEGMLPSRRREYSRKLSIVPAGRQFEGWQKPRILTQVTYFYIDPSGPLLDPELRFSEAEIHPRLFFDEPTLWRIARKLHVLIGGSGASDRLSAEALSILLAHELLRLSRGTVKVAPRQGGLASWQYSRVAAYIHENLAERISLATLAGLTRLSPFHFARAFKQSFGVPPHRYHSERRMERAKELLTQSHHSVTEIALKVGFSETSAFTTAFHRMTGLAPSEYRRDVA